ncbi:MAG: hypothetical protein KDA24_22425, partial [Deltaproteobacteria bacterium]|nr:hypothetical protein [Deltaproteobacteria bacterium]
MHLHDVLRAWRGEIVSESPTVAIADGEDRGLPPDALLGRERLTIPARLRRDEREVIKATLLPARHQPGRPATDDVLDAIEGGLDLELPRPLELLLRLHDGGRFYIPALAELAAPEAQGLALLSGSEMVDAYREIVLGVRETLAGDPDDRDLERIAGRFGARGAGREDLVNELDALAAGADNGLSMIPLVRSPGTRNYITYVPHAGAHGRVGFAFAETGYLPEDTMEYAFEGLEGWMVAVLKSH